ncbi:MipA/OmpV family protein (plasmid) [Pseudoalteromonas sp. T1lg65]|uniref:MipA/OmpV family protein n=1 Tax=Pseudoalteromonas sp. T1lg65 TaxID=2077101 RepID=UPI003F78C731
MKNLLFSFALLSIVTSVAASEVCQQESDDCAAKGQWRFAVAVGAGIITNPLAGGDNIPLPVLPYISYYGDNVFFDNGTLGYTLVEKQTVDLSIIGEINPEQAYFERVHPTNILSGSHSFTGEAIGIPSVDNKEKNNGITIDEIQHRKWAADIGVLTHWYINDSSKLTVSWMHDVTNTYKGQHAKLTLTHKIIDSELNKLNISAGIYWKSKHLIDYYYGVTQQDTQEMSLWYRGKSGVSPFISVAYSYPITTSWQFKLNARYMKLGSAIHNSPIVQDKYSATVFVGGLYAF